MKKIPLIFLLIFLISCAKKFDEMSIDNGEKIIELNVEIADDNEERIQGLMFRENLDQNSGMLFVFDDENYRTFWMKNTLIPLDIIFIDENFEIVDIKKALPCHNDPCELYKSSSPVKYVLELNGNFTAKNSIEIGNKIQITKVFK